MSTAADLPGSARRSWHLFLETYEPLRSDLYRYCRFLTRSPWDTEDLVQDALARTFVTLAQMSAAPPNPRAWLFRVASNLWIDKLRRRREWPAGPRPQQRLPLVGPGGVVRFLVLVALVACTPASSIPRTITESDARTHAHFANVNGLRMYYRDQGEGRPLVLIHGGGSTVETSFGAILPRLARSHRVIAVEEQGHGHTEDLDRPLSFEQMADDTAALLEQLHVTEADVLGFSNGGMTALRLAIRHPSLVRRLVICSGFYAHAGLIPALREGFAQPPDAARMPKTLRDAYLGAAPHPDLQRLVAKTVAMMNGFADVTDDELRAITAPTLVMLGDRDVILPEHAVQLARMVRHGELAILPGAEHGAYLGVAESPPSPALLEVGGTLIEDFLAR